MEDRIDPLDGAFWGRNPHDELAWLRSNAPVWRDPRHGAWGVATYALVKQASSQPKLFSNAGGIRPDSPPVPMVIDMDDPLPPDGPLTTRNRLCCGSMTTAASGSSRWTGPRR